jgi:hypothetical protein
MIDVVMPRETWRERTAPRPLVGDQLHTMTTHQPASQQTTNLTSSLLETTVYTVMLELAMTSS